MNDRPVGTAQPSTIPLALKLVFTLFMLVLVPFCCHPYRPTSLLCFRDVSLFLTKRPTA